jgi:hypothetical protein
LGKKDRLTLIELIRKELHRQADRNGEITVHAATDKPDTIRVNGVLDLYELAIALTDH